MVRLVLVLGATLCLTDFAKLNAAEPVVDRSSELELIRDDFGLADGPSWSDRFSLYVPDVKGATLQQFWPKQKKWSKPIVEETRISATFFNRGQLYVSNNPAGQICVLEGNELRPLVTHDVSQKPSPRPNDLVVNAQGGVYYTLTAPGEVRYLPEGAKESIVVAPLKAPNGIILSPDEQTLYVSAYVDKQVWSYDVQPDGTLGEGKLFATMDDGPEKGADGMSIDRAGNVYCCGAADVWIWSPSGELIEKLHTPTRPINCTFGDSQMDQLYITGFGGLYRQKMLISGRSAEPNPEQVAQESRPSTVIPESVDAHLNVPYAEYGSRKLLADIFVPKSNPGEGHPAVVVVHGGGWLKGDKTKFRAISLEFAKRGYTTMAIEYRLGGEAKFPAGIHDCNAAVRYLKAHGRDYLVDPDRIFAVGGSAGGHLVGLMATGWNNPQLQGEGGWSGESSKVRGAVVMAGPMQMISGSVAERSRKQPESSNSNQWLGKTIDEAPEMYRLADAYEQISADDPPILFIVGELDQPERNEPSRKKLREAGVMTDVVIYPDAKHGCWNRLPWLTQVVDDADRFFKKVEEK